MLPTVGTKFSTWFNLIISVLTGGLAGFDPTLLAAILGPPWGGVIIAVITALNAISHATTGNAPMASVSVTTTPETNTKSIVGPDIAKGQI